MLISNCSVEMISSAAKVLKDGGLVAFPTETVYGLGADAQNPDAISRIYQVKERPKDHPLIVHISEISDLKTWTMEIPDYAIKLANHFWPGPMTLILKRNETARGFITGNQETVGLRIPAHPIALSLIVEFKKLGGMGIAAPSANRFGKVSPTSAAAVMEELTPNLDYSLDQILDGGPSHIGIESTIINCTGDSPEILRLGFITKEMIEESTARKVINSASNIRVSGSMESHYAPNAKVYLNMIPQEGFGFIALSNVPTPPGCIRLASPINLEEYARELYAALRLADFKGIDQLVAITPQGDGLAAAISDRLKKSANRAGENE